MTGFEFFDVENKSILKSGKSGFEGTASFTVNFRKGDRVVGVLAHRKGNVYWNMQFVIMGYE